MIPTKATKPLQAVHVEDRGKRTRGPEDLTRDTPPPDAKSGLTPAETIAALEDAAKTEHGTSQPVPGTFNHRHSSGNNRCGAQRGNCYGEIINGKCAKCGQDYTRTSPPGGTNPVRA